MKHYVYKLTDKISGEFYYGSRTCECNIKDDDYMGSMITWKPIKDNLVKTIIKDGFTTREEATNFEREIVKEHYKNKLNRNYSIPNTGFYSGGKPETNPNFGNRRSDEWKSEQRQRMAEYYKTHLYSNEGKKFSEEWRKNISQSRIDKGLSKGKNNPAWIGYVTVTDLEGNEEIYESTKEASRILGVDAHFFRKHCRNNTTYVRGKYKGWLFGLKKS